MAEFDDLRLSQFWDALAAGQPDPGELDRSIADPLRQVHSLFAAPKPGSARERARQRLIDSTTPGKDHPMSASPIPLGFPSSNGHTPAIAHPTPAIPSSARSRPRWVFAALAATLVLLLGSLGAFLVSQRDTRGPSIPAVVQAPQATASPWSQYRNGPGHPGTTTDLGPETNPGTLWTVQTGDSINSEAAIVDGVAYIGSGDGYLYALDAATGVEQWTFDTGAAVDCGPAVENGIVYVTTRNDELIAIATADGSEQWRVPNINSNASAVLDGEQLYIPRTDGTIAALDPDTGQERWSFATGLTTARTPAVADGIVVAGTEEGTLFALDAADGTQQWSFVSKGGLMSTTVVADGTVYQPVGGGDGNGLYALDLQTGKVRWNYHALDNAGVGIPTVDGTTVYFTADDGRLYALDTSNGMERWLVTKTAPWQADGKVAGNYFYIYHSLEGKLFAFDKSSGAVQWEVAGVDFAAKGPSISGGVLYASTPDGLVAAVATDAPGVLGSVNATPVATPVAATTIATLLWSTKGDPGSPLDMPQGVAIAPDGTIWVTNGGKDDFEIFSPEGEFIRTWGTKGTEPGQFMFLNPTSQGGVLGNVDWDADGNIYVFDTYNARVQKFDPNGTFLLEWKIEGPLPEPLGTVDAATGRVYVTNSDKNRIEVYDPNGNLVDQFGQSGHDPGGFMGPYGIGVDQDSNVYVAEHGDGRIQVFDKFGNLQTARGDGGVLLTNTGEVYYIDVDTAGRIYLPDYRNGKLLVVAPDGTVLTEIEEIDGLGSLAFVTGVAVAPDGTLYLTSEQGNWLAKVQVQLPPSE